MADRKEQPFGLSADQLKNIRVVTARAQVRPVQATDNIQAALEGVLPRVTEGEPTKLLVTAWMCHEGINNNRLAFRKEDLGPAAAKIQIPNLLPMDWNHAAVFGSWDPVSEPAALGVWYAAEEKFNSAALEGKGAWGIETKGVVWAWAFPEKATEMLAMQALHGYIEFSMACLPESYAFKMDEKGQWYEEAINPVFMTLSALSVPPGDPDAKGSVTNLEALAGHPNELNSASLNKPLEFTDEQKQLIAAALKTALQMSQSPKEDTMEKELEELKQALQAAQQALADEQTARKAAETALAAAQASAETAAAEAALKAEGLSIELAKATEELTKVSAELAVATEKVTAFEAAEAARVQAARWAKRMAELPESYRAALADKSAEEKTQFETRWASATDEAWASFVGDLKIAFNTTRFSYLNRSEGALPVVSHTELSSQIAALLR